MTNETLQALAEELSSLDRVSDIARIKTIENAIAEYELGLLKNNGGKAYFPLLKKHNNAIPYEAFYDVFVSALISLLKSYDPAKATFATALAHRLNLRCEDCWRDLYKQKQVAHFSDLRQSNDGGETREFDIADDTYAPDRLLDQSDEFALFFSLAPFVALLKEEEKHLSKARRSFFEGFFTFDTTAQTKRDLFDGSAVIAKNDILFPIMELVVLEYLLEGSFTHMRDVVENAVKDPAQLLRRNETMQACYGLSKPTVVNRNKRYKQLFSSLSA
jgi:hypothetical protein